MNIAAPETDLDKICDLPDNCPFLFAAGNWEWLKVDNSYQVVQNTFEGTKYVRTQTWKGAKKWDENFYGPNAWQLPDLQGQGGGGNNNQQPSLDNNNNG